MVNASTKEAAEDESEGRGKNKMNDMGSATARSNFGGVIKDQA